MRRALVLGLLVGCGGPSPVPGTDDAPAVSPDSPDVSDCSPAGCVWLDEYQQRIVAALSGQAEISPGLTLAHRASAAERDAARQFLLDEFAALGITAARDDYTAPPNRVGANVIATLDATEGTGGLIVLGAHFDSVPAGPGAADNATGVAIVLATARYLKDQPLRKHPVTFALFDQEEIGLVGSTIYAQRLQAAGTEVDAVHVFDMLSFDGDGDSAVELWSPTPVMQALYEEHGAALGMPISAVAFDRSDHKPFLDLGYAATGIGEEFAAGDHTPHYHLATDTFANVTFAHCAKVTLLAFAVLEATIRE